MHSTHYLFSDWPKAWSEFSKSAHGTSLSGRLYDNHVRNTQGHGISCQGVRGRGNYVKFAHFVLFADLYIFARLEINFQFHSLS